MATKHVGLACSLYLLLFSFMFKLKKNKYLFIIILYYIQIRSFLVDSKVNNLLRINIQEPWTAQQINLWV